MGTVGLVLPQGPRRSRGRVRVATVLVVALAGGGCGSGDDTRPVASAATDRSALDRPAGARPVVALSVRPRMPAGARTVVDRRDRLRVTLPATWHRASDRATDRVAPVDRNLLAVGTAPVRPRPQDACSDDVGEPRVAVGPTDALVVVQEDVRSRADLARERPRLRLLQQAAPPGTARRTRRGVFPSWPCRNVVGASGLHEPSFADGGRVFTVTAIVGEAATDRTRSETLAVLESLRPLAE